MAKQRTEINTFSKCIIGSPSETDIPKDAASYSVNIDPNSEEGKKIMKLHAEQFKNQRKPKKGVQINEVDMKRNKDGKD